MKNISTLLILPLIVVTSMTGRTQAIYGNSVVCPGDVVNYTTDAIADYDCSLQWTLSNYQAGMIGSNGRSATVRWNGLAYNGLTQVDLIVQQRCLLIDPCPDPSEPCFEQLAGGLTELARKTIQLYPLHTASSSSRNGLSGNTSPLKDQSYTYSLIRLNPPGGIAPQAYKWYLDDAYLSTTTDKSYILNTTGITFGNHVLKCIPVNACDQINLSEPEYLLNITIIENCNNTAIFETGVANACVGSTYRFQLGSTTSSYFSGNWPPSPDYTIAIVDATKSRAADITFLTSGLINVEATANFTGCTPVNVTQSVTVEETPVIAGCSQCPARVCYETPIPFEITGTGFQNLDAWQIPSQSIIQYLNPEKTKAEITFSSGGIKNITVQTINSSAGCAEDSYTFSVEVIDRRKADSLVYQHQELIGAPQPLTLVTEGCDELISSCNISSGKTDFFALLHFREGYNWGETNFQIEDIFDIEFFDSGDTPLGTREIKLSIDSDHPEQLYHETLDYFNLKRIVVTPREISYLNNLPDPDAITFSFYFKQDVKVDVSGIQLSLNLPQPLNENNDWEYNFSWEISNGEPCIYVPGYEFQLTKVYEQDGFPNAEDWAQALTIYTESSNTSLQMALPEGSGAYFWRVRPVGNQSKVLSQPVNQGIWATSEVFNYRNVDESKNWIYSRTFTEGNKISEQLTFANGLQQIRQQQAKVSNRVVATQTLQDYAGRDALTTLPVPLINSDNKLGYKDNLIPLGYYQSSFDTQPRNPSTMIFNSQYYSGEAMDKGEEINAGVADAGGYPFTRTLFINDGTGRIKEQSGVGPDHRPGSGHTVRTYYSGASESVMLSLFGEEAPVAANVQKRTTYDANNTASVSYMNKDGKVLATALSIGASEGLLLPLTSRNETTIYEYIEGKTRIGKFLQSTRKPLFFSMPRRLDINYSITPALLSEICAQQCRTCDYRVELILHNQDATGIQPSEKLLGSLDIGMTEACASVTPQSIAITDELLDAEANYILEKRIITNNRMPAGDLTYLNNYINREIEAYELELNNDLQEILNLLNTGNVEGLRTYLTSYLMSDGLYRFPLGCDKNILITLPGKCEDPPAGTSQSCTLNGQTFAEFFNTYWADKPYNENGDVFTVADLYVMNRYTKEKEFYDIATFDQLISNILSENPGIECTTVWEIWRGQVAGYGPSISILNGIEYEEEAFVYEFVMVENFLSAVEATLFDNTPEDAILCQIVEGGEPPHGSFIRNDSDLYGYIQGIERDFEKTRAHAMVYYNEGLDTDEGTRGLRYYFNHIAFKAKEYKPEMTDFQNLCQWSRYQLSQGGNTVLEGQGSREEYKAKATAQCGKACEGRSEAFKQAIINELVSSDLTIKIQFYSISSVSSWDANGNEVIKYVGQFNETANAVVYDYDACEIQAMVDALVENCKSNYCQLDFYTDPVTLLEQLGSPEQIAAMKNVFTSTFEVDSNVPSCDANTDYLAPYSGTRLQVILNEYTPSAVRIANSSPGSAPGTSSMQKEDSHKVSTNVKKDSLKQYDLIPDEIEYKILSDFYNSTNGKNWFKNQGWLDGRGSADFNSWYGIKVKNGDVKSINLNGNNLEGVYTSDLFKLEALEEVNIKNNKIKYVYSKTRDESLFNTAETSVSRQLLQPVQNSNLPEWPLAVGPGASGYPVNAQILDWRQENPELNIFPGATDSRIGPSQAGYNDCGEVMFYLLHSGIDRESNQLFIYNQIGKRLPITGLNAIRLNNEMQVVKVGQNEWFIIYSKYTDEECGGPTMSNSYCAATIVYTRIKYDNISQQLVVFDEERDIPISSKTYIQGKAVSATNNNDKYYLYSIRRVKNNSEAIIDRYLIDRNGITYDGSSSPLTVSWWALSILGSSVEVSPDGSKLAYTNRNQVETEDDLFVFNITNFPDVTQILSETDVGALKLICDICPQPPVSLDQFVIDQGTNSPYGFLKHFEKKLNYVEFSPSGRYLYLVGGGYAGANAYMTYLAQIDLEREELRLQVQDGVGTSRSSGLGTTTIDENWHRIGQIESSFDGRLYFTKRTSPYLYVIPTPDSPLPTNLNPQNDLTLGTPEVPDIQMIGGAFVEQMPENIDGYQYIKSFNPPSSSFDLSIEGALVTVNLLGGEAPNVTYYYDWGDGSVLSYINTHAYFSSGDYTIKTIAQNSEGCVASSFKEITVINDCSYPSMCFHWTDPLDFSIDGVSVAFDPTAKTCEQISSESILADIEGQRLDLITERQNSLETEYIGRCVKNVDDELSISYDLGLHHFTLYYYDRAGNLIRTVPPGGVNPLPVAGAAAITSARSTLPTHQLVTTYQYNSLGQLVEQSTPDGGSSKFYYNSIGMLRFSQNAKQAVDNTYSYTKYDELGRIIEVGQASQFNETDPTAQVNNNNFPEIGSQVTRTIYSYPMPDYSYNPGGTPYPGNPALPSGLTQRNLQNRVSFTYLDDDGDETTYADNFYTAYSYDPHGNVEWLVQIMPGLSTKVIRYKYDLLSGNVLQVAYNPGGKDAFYHKYDYDADNRIKAVFTSTNGYLWDKDASYEYYPHGPLKRAAIGEDHVQGIDYQYTIHGWLKSLNQQDLSDALDPGQDGVLGTTARDVFAMTLNYYSGDYIKNGVCLSNPLPPVDGRDLYNGNISTWTSNSRPIPGVSAAYSGLNGRQFVYDELNRIRESKFNIYDGTNFVATTDYNSGYTYDANGNIKTMQRSTKETVDDQMYHYYPGTNQLSYIHDDAADDLYDKDIDNQQNNNYKYDAIGNLTEDGSVKTNIDWTVYGKVRSVTGPSAQVEYNYDAAGNRVIKEVTRADGSLKKSYYVRDASGNVMAIYEDLVESGKTPVYGQLNEIPMYGSERLGLYRPQLQPVEPALPANTFSRSLDRKSYELKDHLGNVRVVVSDRKLSDVSSGIPSDFTPRILEEMDYYPFGMTIPNKLEITHTLALATLEDPQATKEAAAFGKSYRRAAKIPAKMLNHTEVYEADKSERLTGVQGEIIGLAKSMEVKAGDTVKVEVFAKYLPMDDKAKLTDLAHMMAPAFGEALVASGIDLQAKVLKAFEEVAGTAPVVAAGKDENTPRAYLNYMLFDEDYNLTDAGYQRVTTEAMEDGSDVAHEKLFMEIVPGENGFMYTYLSNESPRATEVYFDDYRIEHVTSSLIGEDGLYRYGFNGKEKDNFWGEAEVATEPEAYPVHWTNFIKTKADGNDLIKTTNTNNWDSGASSRNKLGAEQDGWVEIVADVSNEARMFGLSEQDNTVIYQGIEFAINLRQNGEVRAVENGNLIDASITAFAVGDVIRVERIAGKIYYKRNGEVFYTSDEISTSSLIVDASIYGGNAQLMNAKASFGFINATSSLVAAYDFSGNVTDVASGGLPGTLYGATLTADRAGNVSSAYQFDGVDDYIEIENSQHGLSFMQNTGVFTIETWVKIDDLNARNTFISSAGSSIQSGFTLMYETYGGQYGDHQLRFSATRGIAGDSYIALGAPNTINDSQWHHVAVVGNRKSISFYVDGVKDGESTDIPWLATADADFNTRLGASSNGDGLYSNGLNGALDDIRFYERTFTTAEIKELAQGKTAGEIDSGKERGAPLAASLLLDLPLNGNTTDATGNGHDATAFGGVTLVPDHNGNPDGAYLLDGTDDYMEIADSPELDLKDRDFSISVWVNKLQKTGITWDNIALIGQWQSGSNPGDNSWFLGLGAKGEVDRIRFTYETGTEGFAIRAESALTLNKWHHVVVTRNGGTLSIYQNGQVVKVVEIGNVSFNDQAYPIFIGKIGGGYNTQEQIDDIKIYNRSLTADEIWQLYQDKTPVEIDATATEIRPALTSYDYGFRIYNPALGRFLSVDPLTKSYPMLTPYQFASNRPIDGIDLDGLEYLSAHESRIETYSGRARLKLENFSRPWRNQFIKRYSLHGLDYKEFIFSEGKIVGSTLRPNPKDIFAFGNSMELRAYKSSFSPSVPNASPAEVSHNNNQAPAPGLTRGSAAPIALLNAVNFTLETALSLTMANDRDMLYEHKQAFSLAFQDLQVGIKENLVPSDFQNIEDLSQILNVILQGETTVGNQDLFNVGIDIIEKVSSRRGVNVKPQIKEVVYPTSGLDGASSDPIILYRTRSEMVDPALENND